MPTPPRRPNQSNENYRKMLEKGKWSGNSNNNSYLLALPNALLLEILNKMNGPSLASLVSSHPRFRNLIKSQPSFQPRIHNASVNAAIRHYNKKLANLQALQFMRSGVVRRTMGTMSLNRGNLDNFKRQEDKALKELLNAYIQLKRKFHIQNTEMNISHGIRVTPKIPVRRWTGQIGNYARNRGL